MMSDQKRLVSSGYDRIATAYLKRYGASLVRERWFDKLVTLLPAEGGAQVLDLGCGAGLPVARELVARNHRVVGIDSSARQIALARVNVPSEEFLCADMTILDLPASSFDAVAAFYSVTHVPRAEHGSLLRSIARWLRPGGVFVASLGAEQSPDWQGEWMGTEMFFSHYDAEMNLLLLRDAGFDVIDAEVLHQDNEDARFLWVIATPLT